MPNTNLIRRATGSAGAVAIVTALSPLAAPPAAAAPAEAQQTYACKITVDENPSEPSDMDLTVNVNLDLPDEVKAGDELSVDGNFSVQLPGEMGALFGAYFPSAQVTSDGLMLPVNIGGQEQLVSTSYIDSGKIDTRNPPVVFGADFTTDPVEVPEDAEGDVAFNMPRNDSVPAISTDGMSAFTATLFAEGGLVPGYDKGTDRVSCSSANDESKEIGTVPIVPGDAGDSGNAGGGGEAGGADNAGAAGGGGNTGGASGSAGGAGNATENAAPRTNRVQDAQGGGQGDEGDQGDPGDGENDENKDDNRDDEAAAADDGNASGGDSDANAAATRELADQMRLMSMNQASSNDEGSYVPLSAIGWGTLGIVAASILFTVAMNTRTRRVERAAEDLQD